MNKQAVLRAIRVFFAALSGFLAGCVVDGPENTADGTYTIMLASFNNPWGATAEGELLHIHQSKLYKNQTESHTGWKGMFIINEASVSTLYWGRFKSVDAAQPCLRKAKEYRTQLGNQVFAQAVIVPLPGKGPQDLSEWNIENAAGEWTIMVCVYFDESDARDKNGSPAPYFGHRDRRAIQVCKEMRKNGYEAYYYYGPNRSAVTIGSFQSGVSSARSTDPNTGATIMPGQVTDPKMLKIIQEFPLLIVNELGRQTEVQDLRGNTKLVMQETKAVRIRDFRGKDAGTFNYPGQPQPR
ncbi:MAG: hypothetical protein HZA50_16180 [Planctomycetes bacterium]|nr:hypothetical protein [Planctomycetota bacterium]